MLKKILLALVAVVIAVIAFAATRPDDFHVERTASVQAPPEAIFLLVNDLHRWDEWSPWAKLDPNAKNTFEGAPTGVGSAMSWAGNSDVGEGRMTITESNPSSLVRMKLEFLKPFESTSMAEFTFKGEGPQTVVTWSMNGRNNLMAKVIGLFMNCDKMVGEQFEKGLAQMKAIAEGAPRK